MKPIAAALYLSLAALATVSEGAVIYRETFATTDNNSPISSVNWDSIGGAWQLASGPTGAGKVQDVDNVNAGANSQQILGFIWNGTSSGDSIVYTSEYTIAQSVVPSLNTISWYQGIGNTTTQVRVAVQIDSVWYISSQTFTNTTAVSSGSNFGTDAELKTFNWSVGSAAWLNLVTSTPGDVSIGSALTSDLPIGDITGFGLYFSDRDATPRFDTFQIDAVPEPATVTLVGMLGALSLARRRRA